MSYHNIARNPPANFDTWSEWEWNMEHRLWVRSRQNERGEWDWEYGQKSSPNGPVIPLVPSQQNSPRYIPEPDFSAIGPLGSEPRGTPQRSHYAAPLRNYGQPANQFQYQGIGGAVSNSYTVTPSTSSAYTVTPSTSSAYTVAPSTSSAYASSSGDSSNFYSTDASSPTISVAERISNLSFDSQPPTRVPPTEEHPRQVIPSRGGGRHGSRQSEQSNDPSYNYKLPSKPGGKKKNTSHSDMITAKRTAAFGKAMTELTLHNSKDFVQGMVFKVYWSEPKGAGDTEITSACEGGEARGSLHKDSTYQSIRRFVIVKNYEGHSLCIPILTYGHRGATKKGIKLEHHAIIYTSEEPPPTLKGEPKFHKKAIRVRSETPREKLSSDSRLNYAKVYTIEHNVEVCFIGRIHESSEHTFRTDFERTLEKN